MDYYWNIVALVGTVIFLVSGFLVIINNGISVVDWYNKYAGSEDWASDYTIAPVATVGVLLLLILWPITLALCILSIFRRKTAVAAGAVGIICWAGAVAYISGFPGGSPEYGPAVFVGFVAAIGMLLANFLMRSRVSPQVAPPQGPLPPSQAPMPQATPPPSPQQATTPLCPVCGQPLIFMQQYGRWYCYNCKKYS